MDELAKLMLDYYTANGLIKRYCDFNPTKLQKNIKNILV